MSLNGWALFRPENYILKLMEYDKDGEEVEVGHIVDWDDCPEDYVPPYNSLEDIKDDKADDGEDARRILRE